jgi:hypothetical protein
MLHLGTRTGNGIRLARGMLGLWRDILEPDRDTGPVLLGPNFRLQKSEIRLLAEMYHPCFMDQGAKIR